MIETIKLSAKHKSQLTTIKRRTGVENWNVICRWAFLMSLKKSGEIPNENIPADSNVEMTWRTFSGVYDKLFLALLLKECKERNIEINKKNVNHYFRLHLNRGLSFLMSSQSKNLADYCKEFLKP